MVLAQVIKYDAEIMSESDHLYYMYVLVLRGQDQMSGTVFPCTQDSSRSIANSASKFAQTLSETLGAT